jgi:hypothetical protein
MRSKPPFIDPATGRIDTAEIRYEAKPLARLIGLFVVVALVPRGLESVIGDPFGLGLFSLLEQFVISVGGAIVLMYILTRSIQLAANASQHFHGRD